MSGKLSAAEQFRRNAPLLARLTEKSPKATRILWQDQAEYYFVCETCYQEFFGMQWAGSTRSLYPDWRERAEKDLKWHIEYGQNCEYCGPTGNGGWSIDGRFPAAERRDAWIKAAKEG